MSSVSELYGCKMSLARLVLVLGLVHFARSQGGCPYLSPDLCESLVVSHGDNYDKPSKPSDFSFTLRLFDIKTQEVKNCYNLNTKYEIQMQANNTIKGFFIVQDRDKKFGHFATFHLTRQGTVNPNYYPHATRRGLCSRDMPSLAYSCSGPNCEPYREIRLPYTSPNEVKPVEFRYSVVFSPNTRYIQSESTIFRPCATPTMKPTIEPTTPPPVVCSASEFNTAHKPKSVQQNCRNNITYLNSTEHTEGNNTYDCTYIDARSPRGLKRVDCFTGCNHRNDGRPLCCRVQYEDYVNRTFSCTPRNTSKPKAEIKMLSRLHQRRCECFYCDEVCSARPSVRTRENSVEYDSRETNRVEQQ